MPIHHPNALQSKLERLNGILEDRYSMDFKEWLYQERAISLVKALRLPIIQNYFTENYIFYNKNESIITI
jgi:hypothetical protein